MVKLEHLSSRESDFEMEKLFLAPILLLLLLGNCRSSANSLSSQSCGLSGFDLGTLQEADYWAIRIPETVDCILPSGLEAKDLAFCDIFISVCKPLGEICPDYENSTTCQMVTTTNGTLYYFDMGHYTGSGEFNPLYGNNTGFRASRTSKDSIESDNCNSTVTTGLYFICDPDVSWSSENKNITKRVIVAEQFLSPCSYLVQLRYSGACYNAPTLAPSHCSIANYNTTTLSSREYWTATVDSSACYGSDDNACVIFLAFCHPLPPEVGDVCYNSAVCQKGYSGDDTVQEYSMGAYRNFTQFYENDEEGENGGFHMKVVNGSRPDNGTTCPHGIQSEVLLVCDNSKEWNSQDISDSLKIVYNRGEDPCEYILKFGYNGACRQEKAKAVAAYSPVGWIFIGLFGFAVIVYLGGGSAFLYFVKGARGVRVIPHYDFWRNFMMLVLEGCKFFLDVITCSKLNGKGPTTRQPNYDKI